MHVCRDDRKIRDVAPPDPSVSLIEELSKALLASTHDHGILFAHARDAMSLFEAGTGRFIDVNAAWLELYGYTREEALQLSVTDVSAEPDATRESVGAKVAGADGRRIALRWHKRKDGSVFPVELDCGVIDVKGGKAMFASIRDISERIRAEDALRRSEASFRALIEGVPFGVVVHRDGLIVYANPAGRALLGYDADDGLLGRSALSLVHPEDRPIVLERIERERRGEAVPAIEERFIRRDGSMVHVEVSALPVQYDGAPALLAIVRDLTGQRSMEAQLAMADRLASLGRLAAAVGHEINNPLAYVMGNVELLSREVEALSIPEDTKASLRSRLLIIDEGTTRVRDIVRDLKTLARSDDDRTVPVDVHRSLEVCIDMAAHETRCRARVVRDFGEPFEVQGNEARLGQLFLNLLVNAAHAIPEGNVPDNEIIVRTRLQAGRGVIEIHDTGSGIPAQMRSRVFEPFVTTKAPGAGTGLGLSICHHIVTALGGSIEFEARAPHGTCFRVVLPATPGVGPSSSARMPNAVPPSGSRHRLLIVDDEPMIAHMLASHLDGYDVTLAHSGREAIQLFARGSGYDAILCDLVMGDLTGVDVYEHLSRHHPGQERRILFMSGGAFTARTQDFMASVPNPRLEKPFNAGLADAMIRAIIDEESPE